MEQAASTQKQSKMKKWLIIAIIVAVVGVGVYIFALKKSPKAQYFLAELESMEQMIDFFDYRFKLEKSWAEYQRNNPIGMKLDVSGNYRDQNSYYFLEIEEILNNTALSLETEWDHKNQAASMTVMPNLMGSKLDEASIAINKNELLIDLPFINEVVGIKDEEINDYITMFYDGYINNPQLDFISLFEQTSEGFLLTEVLEHYGQFAFNYLSDDSFTASDEQIEVNGKRMKTKRITLQLTEQEAADFLYELFYEMKNDNETLDRIATVLAYTSGVSQTNIKDDIKEDLSNLQQALKDVRFKNGLRSTVWLDKNTIVQRELEFDLYDEVGLGGFIFDGEQVIDKDGLQFNYDLTMTDKAYDEEVKLELDGAFSRDARQADDQVTYLYDEPGYTSFAFFYEAQEQLEGKEKDFDRKLGLRVDEEEAYIDWSGFYTFDEGRFISDNSFSLEGARSDIADAALQVNVEAEKIREVTLPDKNKVKNIGGMSEEELDDYLYEVIEPGLERWLMGSFLDMSAF